VDLFSYSTPCSAALVNQSEMTSHVHNTVKYQRLHMYESKHEVAFKLGPSTGYLMFCL